MALSEAGSRDGHRRVWALAFPIILSNVSVPLLGAVDTAVVGHLPDAYYLGAVAIGAMIFNFLYWGVGFLRMATTGLVAQAHGAENRDEVRSAVGRALLIGAVIAAILIAAQIPLAWAAFAVVEASAEVEDLARSYFHIRIFAAPAALANYVFLGLFIGLQNARAALIAQLWMNGLNVVLDLVFVVGFGWGVEGVALATAISEYAALLLSLVLANRMFTRLGGRFRRTEILSGAKLRTVMVLNFDIFVRTMGVVFAFAYFTAEGARMGDVTLAANAVLLNFQMFMAHGLDGFAHAAQALGGRAVGAHDRASFRNAVRISSLWAVVAALVFTAVYAVFGAAIIALLTDLPAVRDMAGDLLPWVIVAPLVSVWAFQLDGIFLGATRGKTMRNTMIVSVAVYVAGCALLIPVWGNTGLWLALTLFLGVRGATLGARYPALERSIGAGQTAG
jgi:MATE family multidrug resistance protein